MPSIATALLMAMAVGHPNTASAATIRVTNCNDNGTGSLRSAVFRAASGDTIDLAHLTCSRITLTSGQIVIPQGDLWLVGRSRDALTIDGGLHDRVLWHSGGGRLRLAHLSVANGYRTQADDPREDLTVGGCIRSDGNLELYWTKIHHCTVEPGHGGAVAVPFGNASISHSLLVANAAIGNEEFSGAAAGAYVRHHLILNYSRVSANSGEGGIFAGTLEMSYSLVDHNVGGGSAVQTDGPAKIVKSTIADNDADGGSVGALYIANLANAAGTLIADSTISRNRADAIGGVSIYGDATVVNSTIAFNQESANTRPCAGALVFHAALHLESTIIASNLCAGIHRLDLAGYASPPAIGESPTLVGSHNLVGRSNLPLPADTLSVPPRLGTLANNGGPTPTDALLCDSPAIDRGNNVLNHAYDQRGPGYDRVRGAHTDIGAFEVQNPAMCSYPVSQR